MNSVSPPWDLLKLKHKEISKVTLPVKQLACSISHSCKHLPIVITGCIRVYRPAKDGRMVTLYRIFPGESCVLSVACILNESQFPAIAEVEQEVEVYLIPANRVRSWLTQHFAWQQFIFSQLSQRMADLVELADDLAFHKIDARVARLLAKRQVKGVISATHQQLADEIGSSREVVSRSLKSLESQHWISLQRGIIEINDINRIKELSG